MSWRILALLNWFVWKKNYKQVQTQKPNAKIQKHDFFMRGEDI